MDGTDGMEIVERVQVLLKCVVRVVPMCSRELMVEH